MNHDKLICLYDGFKIRTYDTFYVENMLKRSSEFGMVIKYNCHGDIVYPLTGYFLGCSRSKANKKSMGFEVSILLENKKDRNVICFEISGSFHKFWNNWEHNADTFTYENFLQSLDKIKEIFQLDNLNTRVCNLEIGKNIIIPDYFDQSSKSLTDNCVFAKRTSKNENLTNKNRNKNGQSLYLDNETTKAKIYAKSFQQKSNSNGAEIIRVEAVIRKSRAINSSIGIYKYEDLYDIYYHEKSAKYFQKRFKNLLFYQPAIERLANTQEENILLLNFIKPEYWMTLFKDDKKEFSNKRNQYFSILAKNGVPNISTFIVEDINSINKKDTV